MAEFAVRYTQPLLGAANAAGYLVAVPGVSVLIRQDGVECDVFADNEKTPMDNPVPTGVPPGTAGVDTTGNLTVYLEPGRGYSAVATVGATSTTFAIPDISLDPEEPIPAGAVAEAMLSFGVATQTELDAEATARAAAVTAEATARAAAVTAEATARAAAISGLSGTYAETKTPGVPYVASRENHVDLRDFGALGDGSLINAAIVEAQTAKLPVFIPDYAGRIWETDETIVLKHGVSLVSESAGTFEESPQSATPGPVIRLATGADVDLLVNDPAAPIRPGQDSLHRWQRSRIAGITFDGNRSGQAVAVDVLRFTKAWSIYLDRITVLDGARYGVLLDDCNAVNAFGLTVLGAEKSPVCFLNTADCTWDQVEIGGGFESACLLDGASGNVISGKIYNAGYASRPTLTAGLLVDGTEDEVLASITGAAYLPKSGRIVIGTEQISYTAWESGIFTGCVRAVNGTVKAAHSIGDQIRIAPDHADNVHLVNASKSNVFQGRFDQSLESAFHIADGCDSNHITGTAFLWGLYNLTGQPAVYNDGSYNYLGLALSRHGEADTAVANQTIGLQRGPLAQRNIEAFSYDAGIPTKSTGGFTANQITISNFEDTGFPGNVLVNGRLVQTSETLGYQELRDQTTDPAATVGYEQVYGRSGKLWHQSGAGVRRALGADSALPGLLTPSGDQWTGSTLVLVAGRGYFNRFEVYRTTPVALIAFVVAVVASTDDAVECALYDSAGARLDTSGSVTGKLNALGVRTVTIAETLQPGVYYSAILCPAVGGTAATVTACGLASASALQFFGATAPNMMACQQAGLASLPSTIVPAFATANTVVLAVRES